MSLTFNPSRVRIILGGDVMLGRLVKEKIGQKGPGYPLGKLARRMRNADLTLVNLECAMTSSDDLWLGTPKAFYFGAPPEAVLSLENAGVDGVNLANNHVLDFGAEGLLDTLRLLREHKIGFAGAGTNLDEARRPMIAERKGIRFGMAAYCDHQEDFSAGENRPGIAFLNLEDEKEALREVREDLERMQEEKVNWPILSLHWGPNRVHRPARRFIQFAHQVIDSGYKILFGHSAHVFHGLELYRNCPIFYSTGDLVDDYYVDPDYKNDHQLLFEVEVSRSNLLRVEFYPVFIEECHSRPARGDAFEFIVSRLTGLCEEMGTRIERKKNRIRADVGKKTINGGQQEYRGS